MEEICFGTINNIVMNLSTATVGSATDNSSEVETVVEVREPNCDQLQNSMSLLENSENDKNSQRQSVFNAVLNDETTNSGVLEIFDQNSNPSVAASEANSGIGSIKSILFRDDSGDGSSTEGSVVASRDTFSINSTGPYIVNDRENENANNAIKKAQTSDSNILDNHMHGVIVSNGGATVYLETPVVDDQQQHHMLHHPHIASNRNTEYVENTAKPKRLSDEFLLAESVSENESTSKCVEDSFFQGDSEVLASISKSCRHVNENDTLETDLQHDKMSFRLKKMNINNSANENHTSVVDDAPSSSYNTYPQAIADIQSMDLIERRDFETEQRLTGGILIKSSSLVNKNKLNLNLVQTCTKQQSKQTQENYNDCPSSTSGGRAVSSDSKCAYKDLTSTPTSSRAYNSRLTKSTAKINLCSTLSHPPKQHPQLKQTIVIAGSNTPKLQFNQNLSSVIVEAPASSSSSAVAPTASATADLYSNSNSNDSLTSERCFTNVTKLHNSNISNISNTITTNSADSSSTGGGQVKLEPEVEETAELGCSRTNALKVEEEEIVQTANEVIDDAQPSTSSARCQYAPALKNMRQVNASAQTNEKYLSRAPSCSTSSSVLSGVNLAANRLRRKELTSHLNNNSTSEEVYAAFKEVVAEVAAAAISKDTEDYPEDPWADCEENSDAEEICTCHHSDSSSSHSGSNSSLSENEDVEFLAGVKDADLSNFIQMVSISEDGTSHSHIVSSPECTSLLSNQQQRKRKYNDSRMIDSEHNAAIINSGGDVNSRKRIAYDYTATPRSSHSSNALILAAVGSVTPSSSLVLTTGSPISRRTPRSIIPTRENPPPELQDWLSQFQRWSHAERLLAVDRLIEHCEPTQVRHMMKVIEPQFQRDFISLLPRELALQVLAYLDPMDLLRAAQTCRSWRYLCDDNLLWKEKCRKSQILTELRCDRPKRGRAGNMPHIASAWKAAYMRQHIIEMNWRARAIREPKVLKGHDDHVITCLQFSGNRIVSGSDDNTLKVWSAVTGRCLRTLVGHTGGVWSSQMSGNIIISGSTDRTLKVWNMETGQCVHTLLGHTSTVRCMHLHGKRVVSGSRDATLRVWDIEQGTCLHVLVGHLAAVRCVQYDGKLIVSGAYDYMVKIWHPERQECLHTLQGHTNRVYSLQFDGVHVVSGSLDTSIRVWDVETGNCKHTLMGHQSLTSGMELRQNILVSGNADSTVKVWDITTGQCLQTLSGPNKHQSAVTCLQFNSRFVVTSSDDGTVKLWDVKTGEFIRNLVALDSGGSGGVVWRIRANDTKLICAVGSRNGTEETKLMVLDFDVEGACVKCS